MQIDREGKFRASVQDACVHEAESGAVGLNMLFEVTEMFHAGQWHDWSEHDIQCYGTFWVIKKDGAMNERQVESLRDAFSWNGSLDSVEDMEWRDCQIVVREDTYNGQTRYRAAFVNHYDATGGGLSNGADQRRIQSLDQKFGSQLRAVCGQKTHTLPPKQPEQQAPAPPSPPPPPQAEPQKTNNLTKPAATKQEAWEAWCEMSGDQPNIDDWNRIIQDRGKPEAQFTADDWQRVAEEVIPI